MECFSRERWVTKLAAMRALANATVVTKRMTGWLASQAVLLKRGQVDLKSMEEDDILAVGVCRLCESRGMRHV